MELCITGDGAQRLDPLGPSGEQVTAYESKYATASKRVIDGGFTAR